MKILVCYTRFPWPLDKGDLLTVSKMLGFLAEGNEVDLLTVVPSDKRNMDFLPQKIRSVQTVRNSMLARIWRLVPSLFSSRSLQVDSFVSPAYVAARRRLLETGRYDVVYSHYIRSFGHDDFESYGARKVIGLQLSHQAHFAKAVERERNPIRRGLYATETKRLEFWESRIAGYNDLIHLISPHDLNRIKNNAGWRSRVFFNPHGVDENAFIPKPQSRVKGRVIFTGNLGFQANEDAVLWLVEEVWPRVLGECPFAELWVAGARPTAAVRAAVASARRGTLVDSPASLVEVIQTGDVAVDPLRVGAGLQNKMLEAMGCGLPVVATPLANEGIAAKNGRDLICANGAALFSSAVIGLIRDRRLNEEIGRNARAFIEKSWSWEYHFSQLEDRWRALASNPVMAE